MLDVLNFPFTARNGTTRARAHNGKIIFGSVPALTIPT
jgi:hypothetical protein